MSLLQEKLDTKQLTDAANGEQVMSEEYYSIRVCKFTEEEMVKLIERIREAAKKFAQPAFYTQLGFQVMDKMEDDR